MGKKTIDNVGWWVREVTTLNGGHGNEKRQPVVKDSCICRSRDQCDYEVVRIAGGGGGDFVVGNINLGEPNPWMFEPFAGYRIVPMEGEELRVLTCSLAWFGRHGNLRIFYEIRTKPLRGVRPLLSV